MGGLTLLQLFAAAELGGSAPVSLLKETGGVVNGAGRARTQPGQRPRPGSEAVDRLTALRAAAVVDSDFEPERLRVRTSSPTTSTSDDFDSDEPESEGLDSPALDSLLLLEPSAESFNSRARFRVP